MKYAILKTNHRPILYFGDLCFSPSVDRPIDQLCVGTFCFVRSMPDRPIAYNG